MAAHSPASSPERPRYIEQLAPVVFPESAKVPESQLHLELRTLLYHLLQDALGEAFTVGSDQFVYFDASDPSACLAPDVYVGLSPRQGFVKSWKVWERGAPAVAVEIVSDSDATELPWQEKLSRYRRLGVQELIRFDPITDGMRLRVWDRVEGALTEREVSGDRAQSLVLQLEWVVAPAEGMPQPLRIAQDGQLVSTRREAQQAEAQARQAETQARKAAEVREQVAVERIKKLEAELQRRK
jgi:Uma2 family endonuclease